MDPSVIVAITGVIGVGVTWALGRRAKSGKITTTEAETLWQEAREMRAERERDNAQLRTDLSQIRDQLQSVHAEHEQCKADLATSRLAISQLSHEIEILKGGQS